MPKLSFFGLHMFTRYMLQYIKLVWKKIFFQKFQTKPQKHIKSKVAVKNNSYFFEIIRARSLVVSIMAYSYTEKHLLVAVLF